MFVEGINEWLQLFFSGWEKKWRGIIWGTMSHLGALCSHPGRQKWGDEEEMYFEEKNLKNTDRIWGLTECG